MHSKKYKTVEEAKRERVEQRKAFVVGVVDPQGIVREIVCKPSEKDEANGLRHGQVPVELIEGEVTMTVLGKRGGWRFLKDMCEQDGKPEIYERWLEVVRARLDGVPVHVPSLEVIYPPSLLEARKNVVTRSASTVFVAGKGMINVAGLSPGAKRERIARLGASLGMELAAEQPAAPGGA